MSQPEENECNSTSDDSGPISDSRIPVSTEVRRQLKIMKARHDHPSYDRLLRELIEDAEG